MNWLADMDWGWWPMLFLRPPKDRDIDAVRLLKMTPFFGSAIGLSVFGVRLALTKRFVASAFILDVLVGWVLFFAMCKCTLAYFWNRRARRLRGQQTHLQGPAAGKPPAG